LNGPASGRGGWAFRKKEAITLSAELAAKENCTR